MASNNKNEWYHKNWVMYTVIGLVIAHLAAAMFVLEGDVGQISVSFVAGILGGAMTALKYN